MAWIMAAVVMAWLDSASTRAAASRALSFFGLASLGALWVLADVVGSLACRIGGLSASGGAGWGAAGSVGGVRGAEASADSGVTAVADAASGVSCSSLVAGVWTWAAFAAGVARLRLLVLACLGGVC